MSGPYCECGHPRHLHGLHTEGCSICDCSCYVEELPDDSDDWED